MPMTAAARLGALSVPASQVALAASGYLLLVAAGHALPVEAFAAIAAFSMLLNTVARGIFSAAELELTRAVAAARATGDPGRRTVTTLYRRLIGLLAGTLVLLAVVAPVLITALGGDRSALAWLFVAAVTITMAHAVRGPLAALGRFGSYAATYAAEAAFGLAGAALLLVVQEHRPAAWCAVLALAPLLALLVVVPVAVRAPLRRRMIHEFRAPADPRPVAGAPTTGGLLWSVLLFLSLQGLWNLAAVVVTARAERPEIAAGFAAISILLRTPFLAAPAIQALLLPTVTAEVAQGERGLLIRLLRRHAATLVLIGCAWIIGALTLLPPFTRALFGLSVLPSTGVLLALAISPLLGVAAFVVQTQLVAQGQQRAVALSWLAGLVVLIAAAAAPLADVDTVGGLAQLLAALVVLVSLLVVLRRYGPGASTSAARRRRTPPSATSVL